MQAQTKGYTVSITLKEFKIDAMPVPAAPPQVAALNPELISMVHKQIQAASIESIERSQKYIDAVMRDVLNTVEKKLELIEAPRPQVLAVEVEGELRKLKSIAAPYLGEMIINAKLGLPSMLIGPAGCGKSVAAEQLATALGMEYDHVSLTAGASETWLFGRQTPNGFIEAPFSRFYREGGVFCLEEMDAADANLLLALNTALANKAFYNPISGQTYPKHENFICVATANTMGKGADAIYTGRVRLDGSSLDRFVPIMVDYNADIEKQVCPDKSLYKHLVGVRSKLQKLKADEILSTRKLDYAYKRLSAGIPLQRILETIASGWPSDLVEQTGILQVKDATPPKKKVEVIPAGANEEAMTF